MAESENTTPKECWFALYTKPRHEFKAALQLENIGVKYYLPTITRLKQWSDRKKKVTEPVFSGYIFIYGNEKARLSALEQYSIVRSIFFNRKPATVPDWQIDNLKIMLEEKREVFVSEEIKVGTKVKIISGPFTGVEGIVYDSAKNEKMLAITIDLLRRSVNVLLPSESVIKT